MDQSIDGPAVAGVFQAPAGLEHLKAGLDAESFAQQHLVQQGHRSLFMLRRMLVTR